MKEFMLQFKEGQEYLISERKLRWTYQHGISSEKYRRDVDRELTVRQLEIIRGNPDNGYYKFYYNGSLIENFSIDVSSDPNLVIIKIDDPFPGYAPGHTVYQSLPYDAKARPIERFFVKVDNGKAFIPRLFGQNQAQPEDQQTGDTPLAEPLHCSDTVAGERSDRQFQQQHQGFQPASGHEHRSENQSSTEEPSLGFVERLIRESIQVIPLELVRINTPAVVLVRVPETGEENRYMMTLSPIARS